jgi:UTP--glucose-1-phosphate uridylyltransferase
VLYEEFQCSIVAVQEVPMDEVHQYGVVAGTSERDGLTRVTEMVEKPREEEAPSNLAVIGRYILTPDIFDIIRSTPPGRNGEVQLTDALQTQASEGRVLAYQFEGLRFDCGSVPGFVEATQHVFEHYYGQE